MAQEDPLNSRSVEECLQEIREARDRLGTRLLEAQHRLSVNPLDWREWVRRHPIECEATAFVLGFLLSDSFSPSRPGERTMLQELGRAGLSAAAHRVMSSLLV